MATIKKKAGLGSTIGGILGGPLGFLGGRSMDRKNQAIKDETIQPAKTGKKVVKKMQEGGKVKDSWLAKTVGKRSKLDDYKDAAAKWVSKKTGISQSSSSKTSVKKAGLGIKVRPKNLNERQIGRVDRIESSDPLRARTVANRISDRRNARGAETSVKPMAKSMMKSGGKTAKKK